ncbi:MAG: glmM: phosphoglucosamine mutase, partial [Acidimicrobiaceae bacterium]|nr:glmM: phosphoglucosamine mutase [Acidimicrobiaceae bacterium]
MSLRFGTDGIRGVANAELTPEIALAIGRAAARRMGGETFLVGRDTRRSGPMLLAALAAGLSAEGASVVDLGVLPTPALAWLAANRAQPAAMISASHNPYADNGIKLLSKGGTKLAEAMERAVEDELDLLVSSPSGASATRSGEVGEIRLEHEAVSDYADYLVGSIRLAPARRLKVVCDCANGAASEVAPLVLSRLGIEAVVVAADPDGVNINA